MNNVKRLGVLGAIVAVPSRLFAVSADASTITATATTAFEAVSLLVVAIAGFYIVLRIVKGIRK